MILVIGATGKVGGHAVRSLVERGLPVRAFSRHPSRVGSLGPGVETFAGDLDTPETVRPAFEGVERVLVVAAGPDIPAQEARLIDAAAAAHVEHLVLVSSLGVDAGVASGPLHAPGEKMLRSSALSWTILRPGVFMANALMWGETIRAQRVFYDPTGSGRHAMIDPVDIGEVAAALLADGGDGGRTYELTGAEAISSADCARALSAVLGTDVAHVDLSDEAFREGMSAAGAPPPLVDALARYYAMVRAGEFDMVTSTVEDVLGRPARTFVQWVADNRSAFA